MTTTAVTIELDLPEDLVARYERLAQSTGRTIESHMIEALIAYIDKLEAKCETLNDAEDCHTGCSKNDTLEETRV